MAYLLLEALLGGSELVDGGLGVFEGLDEHAVLYALLKYALYAAVCGSNLEGEGAHFLYV